MASAVDAITSRNSTRISIVVNGARVGRVQSFNENISNNVQVLAELGRAYMAEIKKGITSYSFSIAKFYARNDAFEALKLGAIFSLEIRDENLVSDGGTGVAESLEYFPMCAMQSVSLDYTIGQATVGQNASVVTIGKGLTGPQSAG